jgi:hypothetical protein
LVGSAHVFKDESNFSRLIRTGKNDVHGKFLFADIDVGYSFSTSEVEPLSEGLPSRTILFRLVVAEIGAWCGCKGKRKEKGKEKGRERERVKGRDER